MDLRIACMSYPKWEEYDQTCWQHSWQMGDGNGSNLATPKTHDDLDSTWQTSLGLGSWMNQTPNPMVDIGICHYNQHKVTMMRIWINCLHSLPVNPDSEANQEGIGFIHIDHLEELECLVSSVIHRGWYATNNNNNNNTWLKIGWLRLFRRGWAGCRANCTAANLASVVAWRFLGVFRWIRPYAMDQNQTPQNVGRWTSPK